MSPARPPRGGVPRGSALALVASLACGCAWGTVTPEEFDNRRVHGVCGPVFDSREIARVLDAVQAKVGSPLRVTAVDLHPGHASVDARTTAHPRHLDRYSWRDGEVAGIAPIQVSAREDLDARTFARDEVQWERLPGAMREGLDALGLESVQPTHVAVRRDRGAGISVRVHYSGPRGGGTVDLDAHMRLRAARVD